MKKPQTSYSMRGIHSPESQVYFQGQSFARGESGLADKLLQNWKISVLIGALAPDHLQEKWFTRYRDEAHRIAGSHATFPKQFISNREIVSKAVVH